MAGSTATTTDTGAGTTRDRAVAISDTMHQIDAASFTRYTCDTIIGYQRWKTDEDKESAVNALVPKRRPKKFYSSISVALSGSNEFARSVISKTILKVDGSNISEKNPTFFIKTCVGDIAVFETISPVVLCRGLDSGA